MYKIKWHPAARKEYRKSFGWYLERSETAAENFLNQINEALLNISKHPLLYRKTYSEYRENVLVDFPFTIVFRIENNNLIIISAVYHQKRNPDKKYR